MPMPEDIEIFKVVPIHTTCTAGSFDNPIVQFKNLSKREVPHIKPTVYIVLYSLK